MRDAYTIGQTVTFRAHWLAGDVLTGTVERRNAKSLTVWANGGVATVPYEDVVTAPAYAVAEADIGTWNAIRDGEVIGTADTPRDARRIANFDAFSKMQPLPYPVNPED